MGELANQIALSTGGVTRLIDRLEDDGYVARVVCPSDRRATFLELTDAGIECLEVATATYLALLDHFVVNRLATDDLAVVDRSLAILVDER